jgi:type 1 glutamine amidotransferase
LKRAIASVPSLPYGGLFNDCFGNGRSPDRAAVARVALLHEDTPMRMSLLGLLAAALLVAGLPFFATAQNQPRPKKIVLMGMATDHAKGEHEYMAGLAILAECLKETPGVEVTVIKVNFKGKGWPEEAKALEDADCVVCYCKTAGTYFLADGERKEKFHQIMKKGAGFVSLHWAVETTKALGTPEFMSILGGYYEPNYSDNPHNTATVQQPDTQHPIARGWKPFEARDEFYYKIRLMPEAKAVMSATVMDRKKTVFPNETIGWIYKRQDKGPLGDGRSFGFTGGHFHLNWGIPEFRRMIVNGILWTAGIDVPQGGAPVDLKAPVPKIPDGKGAR